MVHVASLPCRREGRSRHFFQKNIMVSAHFSSQARKWSCWLQGDPGWLQRAPRCPSKALWRCPQSPFWNPSSRVLPPSWRFLLQDSSPRISLLELLLEDSSSRMDFPCWIPVLVFLFQDSSSRIPPPGFPFLAYSSRIPLPGFLL